MFNPETRKYVWDVCKKNYYDYGINAFWLDNSEPDYGVYDFDHYRYIEGPALSCSNIYPQLYSRVFYDNMKDLGDVRVPLKLSTISYRQVLTWVLPEFRGGQPISAVS